MMPMALPQWESFLVTTMQKDNDAFFETVAYLG